MNTAERIEGRVMKPNGVDTRVALLEQSHDHIGKTLSRIEMRFDRIEERFDRIEKKIEEKFEKVEVKIDSNLRWLIGLIISILFSTATIALSIFHFHT
jgi:tetrahydromethanopterin S-methyltransferase subunit G